MAVILDGAALAAKLKARIREEAGALPRPPMLAVVLAGEDPASQIYVRGKERDCAECGIRTRTHRLPADVSQRELSALVDRLNRDGDVDGILVQLPLPEGLDPRPILHAVSPEKDVDCFHPLNAGLLALGEPRFLPCTPAGVLELLDAYEIPVRGRLCVIIGRSHLVGRPLAQLLTARDGTVTLCHSRTADLPALTRQADILVSAAGRRGLVTADMIKPGAAVIDVAMNRDPGGKLAGDVDFPAAEAMAGFLTPVPGGVGPMTRAMLLRNVLQAADRR
ncbi:bifunctional 5,10-methylenetetrahydrofolate dehydrogenase/5,10-methenyltetrahydrofolate cyclohydrolase [uncultured Oscillibacter sp.]|uniref:bifunctional 5,10-methylenetetrahydrofolate dehydrogenase/5,10-methenyltetrahydrofolate cyclohydrolase n=1 Tax=uncultured Oscillibacter sp. TaxID=876091 RepID=UPI002614BEAD|nr:bifunctional 5,10-methylenetetrahydrofolate dehydrogenase/5,10-methenyltetrahydrofolate cyclohydrolase [uncultured Oscillibacter sp.]